MQLSPVRYNYCLMLKISCRYNRSPPDRNLIDNMSEKAILKAVENHTKGNGNCPHCGGSNLTAYIDEITKDSAIGNIYCHDCTNQTPLIVSHNVNEQLENAIEGIKDKFSKTFNGR